MRAATLSRVSKDGNKSVEEQSVACLKAAAELGWEIVSQHSDQGISASRFATKARAGWQMLRAEIEQGLISGVVLWESSRGSRELTDWSAFLSLCRIKGVLIHVVSHQRTYDLSIARDWRSLAEDGVDSAFESEKTSERLRRALAARKAEGRPLGLEPTGYRKVRNPRTGKLENLEPDERAPAVARMITAIASGVPVSHAARAAGIKHQSALRIARNVAYIGQRPGPDGELIEATWPAIVDEGTFWRAQAVLDSHRGAGIKPGNVKSLLTHLAVCGKCGGPVIKNGATGYRCKKGCLSYRDWQGADLEVMFALQGLLMDEGVLERFAPADQGEAVAYQAEADALRHRLDEAIAAYTRGELTVRTMKIIEDDLTPKITAAEDLARKAKMPPVLAAYHPEFARLGAAWDVLQAMPLAAQRDVLRELVTVTFHGRGDTRGRIEVLLRD